MGRTPFEGILDPAHVGSLLPPHDQDERREHQAKPAFGAGIKRGIESCPRSLRGETGGESHRDRPADIVFVVFSHETYLGLTGTCGWSLEDYKAWLYTTLCDQLLPTPSRRRRSGSRFITWWRTGPSPGVEDRGGSIWVRDRAQRPTLGLECETHVRSVSEEDRRHWDLRHAEAGMPSGNPRPPRIFASHEELFPVGGRALEIACGRGETAVWLASRGMDVHAVDVSPVAIELAHQLALRNRLADRLRFEVWDLDDGLPPGQPMDLVVCHMFRLPGLDSQLLDRLATGGVLAVASLSEVGAGPGRFRAGPGELRAGFSELQVLAEGEGDGEAWLLGRKSA